MKKCSKNLKVAIFTLLVASLYLVSLSVRAADIGSIAGPIGVLGVVITAAKIGKEIDAANDEKNRLIQQQNQENLRAQQLETARIANEDQARKEAADQIRFAALPQAQQVNEVLTQQEQIRDQSNAEHSLYQGLAEGAARIFAPNIYEIR